MANTVRTQGTSERLIKTLLLTDLVGSTKMVEAVGDERAAQIFERFDYLARDLLIEHDGLEIDRADGFLLLFDRPIRAVLYALDFHDQLVELSRGLGLDVVARVGIHLGEVVLRRNPTDHVARGAKQIELEGLAKPIAARIMSLAVGRQTLLTRPAFELARRAVVGNAEELEKLVWIDHGPYEFHGIQEPQSVCEVRRAGPSSLAPPPDCEKVWRVESSYVPSAADGCPSAGQSVLERPGWTLERKLAENPLGQLWLAGKHRDSSVEATISLSVDERDFATHDQRAFLFAVRAPSTGGRGRWTICDPVACLLVVSGDQAGGFTILEEGVLSAGRDPAMDLHFHDPKVSRSHFEIRRRNHGCTVKALNAKNGVFVNGIKIEKKQRLQNGDEIRVGETELLFYEDRGDA
jgi:class 3 adenylate cyclase